MRFLLLHFISILVLSDITVFIYCHNHLASHIRNWSARLKFVRNIAITGISTLTVSNIDPRVTSAVFASTDFSTVKIESTKNVYDTSFYDTFPYKVPKDILNFINFRNPSLGDSNGMLQVMDEFATKYPMYKLSNAKATILNEEIVKRKPKRILEIGTFFGYSAINILQHISSDASLTCIEANDDNADVARSVVAQAMGPKNTHNFRIITGISKVVLVSDELKVAPNKFDFVFLDHDKDSYLSDLQTLESKGFLAADAVIVADNVVFPGAPGYLEYVGGTGNNQISANGKYKTVLMPAPFERIGFETQWKEVPDAMSVSVSLHREP